MALIDRLTAIGNAIREKTGTTDLIPLADMPSAIASISGGGTTGRRTVGGTFTLDANARQPIITHNCGFVPSFFMVYPKDTVVLANRMAIGCIIVNNGCFNDISEKVPEYKTPHFVWECQDDTTNWYTAPGYPGAVTENTAQLPYRSGTYIWKANFEYGWVAIE